MFNKRTTSAEADESAAYYIRDLASIKTLYGRLVYLANSRNADTGRYEHPRVRGASGLVGSRTLKRIHEKVFTDWLSLPLERKKVDIESYISGLNDVDHSDLIDNWLRLKSYQALIPAAARATERHQYISEVEVVLELLSAHCRSGAAITTGSNDSSNSEEDAFLRIVIEADFRAIYEQSSSDVDGLWVLITDRFWGYFRWTVFAMLATPVIFWMVVR